MSDVNLGGETNFPDAVDFKPIQDANVRSTCRNGLRVKPQEGKVIVFYSLRPDGSGDELSQHAACPVLNGTKWAANKCERRRCCCARAWACSVSFARVDSLSILRLTPAFPFARLPLPTQGAGTSRAHEK